MHYLNLDETKLYFLKQNHFKQHQEFSLIDNKNGTRPYYLCIKNSEYSWVIPLSSKVDKYKKMYEDDLKRGKKPIKYHFIKISGKESVVLIQNAFPVSNKNIKEPYIKYSKYLEIRDLKDISEIKKKLNTFKHIVKRGIKLYPNQPDIHKLEQKLINQIKEEKYISSLFNENKQLPNPLKLDRTVISLIIKYNENFKEPKSLKDICLDYKLDKNNSVKNPLLQSIGTYFATQQQNEINILNKEIDVAKKEVAYSTLEQD
jgi:hypothetical protein